MSETREQVWRELEAKAKACQRTWGLGFPVISVALLRPFIKRLLEAKP